MNFAKTIFFSAGLLLTSFTAQTTQAAFFDLRGALGTELEGAISGSISVGGITATLTANSGILNQSSLGFGVNATGSGDDAARLDGDVLAETITLTFNIDVLLDQIQLAVLSEDEEGALTVAGGSPISLVDTGAGDDEYNFNANNTVLTTDSVVLSWVSGNGFSFDDFTVSPLSPLDGDFDADADRDGADFLVWQRDLSDTSNLTKWENNYGVLGSLAVTTPVPEPTGLLLLISAMTFGWPFRSMGETE